MTPRQARLTAARARADEVRRDLHIDDRHPIDVFEAIRRSGIWLVFHAMDGVLGVTLRQGAGGILINPERPLGMQRFTAAHELGHWYLHDDAALDDEDDVSGADDGLRESEAHAFASAFLMPRRLVNQRLRHYGIQRHAPVDALIVYQVSRDLGVSYTALLVELRHLNVVTRAQQEHLGQTRVAHLKQRLSQTPAGRSHVWTTAGPGDVELDVTVGDTVVLTLPENPTTGYRWSADPSADHRLSLRTDSLELSEQDRFGTPGIRKFVLGAGSEGRQILRLVLRRPWETTVAPIETASLTAFVAPTPADFNRRVLAPPLTTT